MMNTYLTDSGGAFAVKSVIKVILKGIGCDDKI